MASTLKYQYHVIRDTCRELEKVLAEPAAELARREQASIGCSKRGVPPLGNPAPPEPLPEDCQALAVEAYAALNRLNLTAEKISTMLEKFVRSESTGL